MIHRSPKLACGRTDRPANRYKLRKRGKASLIPQNGCLSDVSKPSCTVLRAPSGTLNGMACRKHPNILYSCTAWRLHSLHQSSDRPATDPQDLLSLLPRCAAAWHTPLLLLTPTPGVGQAATPEWLCRTCQSACSWGHGPHWDLACQPLHWLVSWGKETQAPPGGARGGWKPLSGGAGSPAAPGGTPWSAPP